VCVSQCLSVCLLDITVSCAKTEEPIEIPFGLWIQVDPRNHVLGGGPDPTGGGAIGGGFGPLKSIVIVS